MGKIGKKTIIFKMKEEKEKQEKNRKKWKNHMKEIGRRKIFEHFKVWQILWLKRFFWLADCRVYGLFKKV